MPNHITNILSIIDLGGVRLSDVHAALLNEERQVDFSVIAPSPKCLDGFNPHFGVLSRAKMALGILEEPALSLDKINSRIANLALSDAIKNATSPIKGEDIEAVIRAISNHQDCGHIYWYDWNIDNWGTKWNAYGQPKGGFSTKATSFKFQTAWSHPEKMIKAISEKLPDVAFALEYADEDIGSNCGTYAIKNGQRSNEHIAPKLNDQTADQKKQFSKLAFGICYDDEDPASHGYDENWEYSDEAYVTFHRVSDGNASPA